MTIQQLHASGPAGGGPGSLTSTERHGGTLVLVLDNPPVNALGAELRQEIAAALQRARDDDTVEALVIVSSQRVFSAGADISQLGKTTSSPPLSELNCLIEAFPKPIVAAVAGAALGGGFELALACTARIAAPDARFGLPEIKLGLIPGAGGTQRLPRLIGRGPALSLAAGGEPMDAARAHAIGAIDAIAENDLRSAAVAFAERIAAGAWQRPARPDADGTAMGDGFETLVRKLTATRSDEPALQELVHLIGSSTGTGMEEGLEAERQSFRALLQDERSKALRYQFGAERRTRSVEGLPAAAPARPVKVAGVIGAGTMGSGIAVALASAGVETILVETSDDPLAAGLRRIDAIFDSQVRRGAMNVEEAEKTRSLIRPTVAMSEITGSDLVIEAAYEDLEVKTEIVRSLADFVGPQTIVATNTSYIDVNRIAEAARYPRNVLGMHFFSPAHIMRLVEVVRGDLTDAGALQTTLELARRLKKLPVVVGVCPGFVGNRMLARRSRQVEALLLAGVRPHQLDKAAVDFGFKMGPCAVADLAGLDIGWRNRKANGLAAPITDRLCEMGHFGQKTGQGYYSYADGGRKPARDPVVEDLIREVSGREPPTDERDILPSLLYPMINEAAAILSEGIVPRASDIDVIWVNGYGWPAWRGGPMHFADATGLETILDWLESHGGPDIEISGLLRSMVSDGMKFSDLPPVSPSKARSESVQ